MVSTNSSKIEQNKSSKLEGNNNDSEKEKVNHDSDGGGKVKKFVDPGLPKFSIQDLMNAGVHYGHRVSRWNPRMGPYIYGQRNGIYVFDLNKTYVLLNRALKICYEVAKNNGRILFVGTKRQIRDAVKESAILSGQYYVSERWLGGMLTNWTTIARSAAKLEAMEVKLKNESGLLKKKELLVLQRKRNKLQLELSGIRNMGAKPDLIVVFDTNVDNLAVQEAYRLGIPIIAIVDSNSSLNMIDYPIPGNDDSIKAIDLYCKLISESIILGMRNSVLKDVPSNRNSKNDRNNNPRNSKSFVKKKDDAEGGSSEDSKKK